MCFDDVSVCLDEEHDYISACSKKVARSRFSLSEAHVQRYYWHRLESDRVDCPLAKYSGLPVMEACLVIGASGGMCYQCAMT